MSEVNMKSTKDVIYAALQEAQTKVKQLEANKLDPKKEVEVKKAAMAVEKAEVIVNGGVKDIIATISEQVAKALAGVADNIEGGIAEYNEVKAAIELKKAELKDLFGVEDALLNLATVINSQNDMKTKFNEQYAADRTDAMNQIKELETKISTMEADFKARIKAEEDSIKANRKKEEEEYKYATARTHKIAEDSWTDEMAAKRKVFNTELEEKNADLKEFEKQLDERDSDLQDREDKLEELEAKVDEIPGLIEDAVNKAKAEAEASAKKSFGFEVMMIKKENEGKVALLEAKINTLETNTLRDANTIADLQNKLNVAYAEMKDMATKSIEGASNARAYASLESVVRDNMKTGTK